MAKRTSKTSKKSPSVNEKLPVNDATKEMADQKAGIIRRSLDATKNLFIGLAKSVKGIAVSSWEFLKGFFNKETLQSYADTAKLVFAAIGLGVAGWMLGTYTVAAIGVAGLGYVAAGGVVASYGVSKACDYAIHKEEEQSIKASKAA